MSEDLQLEYAPVEQEIAITRYESPVGADPSVFSSPGKGRLFLRILSIHVRAGMLEEFTALYKGEIIPGLRSVPGCRFAFLTGQSNDSHELISVTIWNSRADAEAYESNGQFAVLNERVGHTLEDSTRWMMNTLHVDRALGSDDMTVSGYTLIVGQVFGAGK